MGKQVIVFDLGGVLMEHDIPGCIEKFKRILGGNFNRLGLGADGEGEADALMGRYEKGLVATEEFVGTILGWCIPGTTAREVEDAWNAMHAGIPSCRIDKLKQLKAEGYTLYLLSNNNELHWRDVLNRVPDFGSLFDDVFLSFREHVSKPDERLFRILMERTGADPRDIIFVDDLAANRRAAEDVGWQTCESLEELDADGCRDFYGLA